uniref:Uncharacterized protein n=1 Tax=Mycena chlorophos TaxID=658473 RepID=A0ABQ0L4L9_MYCCL|nr:predicted protein [Mycena chlorophos]
MERQSRNANPPGFFSAYKPIEGDHDYLDLLVASPTAPSSDDQYQESQYKYARRTATRRNERAEHELEAASDTEPEESQSTNGASSQPAALELEQSQPAPIAADVDTPSGLSSSGAFANTPVSSAAQGDLPLPDPDELVAKALGLPQVLRPRTKLSLAPETQSKPLPSLEAYTKIQLLKENNELRRQILELLQTNASAQAIIQQLRRQISDSESDLAITGKPAAVSLATLHEIQECEAKGLPKPQIFIL